MNLNRLATSGVVLAAMVLAFSSCSSTGGKHADTSGPSNATQSAPAPVDTDTPASAVSTPDGTSGEDDLAGHLNGEPIADPCLSTTVAEFAAAMGYEPNLVKPTSGDSCGYIVETKGHRWDVLARYETPSTFRDGVERGNEWTKRLSGFPVGTEAWSINVNTGGIITFAYLPRQKVALECSFLVSGGDHQTAIDKSAKLCRWYANIAVKKLPAIG